MIPTYRPQEAFLRKTLESVLQQDAGADTMQIEVVDDGSPEGNVEAMVKSIAGARVQISRTPKNLGLAGCWNTCIERARGQWVHLLHHDDYVLPGFYAQLKESMEKHPGVALVASRCFSVDEQDVILDVSPRVPELESGKRAVECFFYANPIQCPGVVMRREFYEAHGGFRPDLFFVLDVEMWARAVGLVGGVVLPEVLACFRTSEGQTTSRLERSGESLRDVRRLIEIYASQYPEFDRQRSLRQLCEKTLEQARNFSKAGDAEAARANWDFWRTLPATLRLTVFASRLALTLSRRLALRKSQAYE
jgi:GT2 family glycosyltransferase